MQVSLTHITLRRCAWQPNNSQKEGPLLELSPTGLSHLLEAVRHLAAPDCQGVGLISDAGSGVLAALLSLLQVRAAACSVGRLVWLVGCLVGLESLLRAEKCWCE